jgi:hypothetical protein
LKHSLDFGSHGSSYAITRTSESVSRADFERVTGLSVHSSRHDAQLCREGAFNTIPTELALQPPFLHPDIIQSPECRLVL